MFSKALSYAITLLSLSNIFGCDVEIVTVDGSRQHLLRQETTPIYQDEFPLAREISEKLLIALTPYLPAAGLAAPQIGISKSVFIFSFDRDPLHFETVINPSFIPLDDTKIASWEACFSVILSDNNWKMAKVPRYSIIRATYYNLEGQLVEKILEGFAARVFQHEYDHLQGIESIDREDAIIKTFSTKEELLFYMQAVKKEDANQYKKPNR